MRASVWAVGTILLALSIFPAFPIVSAAMESAAFQAAIDAEVRQNSPNTNFGSDSPMRIGTQTDVRRVFIQFDLSSVESGSGIISATLSLRAVSCTSSGVRTFNVHTVAASWVEASVTWNTQPATVGSPVQKVVDTGILCPVQDTFDVTEFVQAWVDAEIVNNGMRLSDSNEATGALLRGWVSRDGPSQNPHLDVVWRTSPLAGVDLTALLMLIAFIVILVAAAVFVFVISGRIG